MAEVSLTALLLLLRSLLRVTSVVELGSVSQCITAIEGFFLWKKPYGTLAKKVCVVWCVCSVCVVEREREVERERKREREREREGPKEKEKGRGKEWEKERERERERERGRDVMSFHLCHS